MDEKDFEVRGQAPIDEKSGATDRHRAAPFLRPSRRQTFLADAAAVVIHPLAPALATKARAAIGLFFGVFRRNDLDRRIEESVSHKFHDLVAPSVCST
ncbi:hypothetical protein [Rhizobium hidalgonense]|uniref:hypothetical protein n=1 Tax=Rhizobium hidalgonense TaxID=1538159 RepID=UPI0013E3F1C7|nr:hypothetical protein [Rhizobium hidalgonense]MDR9807046.1 hypothetical protein [Rhizobium hidalgonense]